MSGTHYDAVHAAAVNPFSIVFPQDSVPRTDDLDWRDLHLPILQEWLKGRTFTQISHVLDVPLISLFRHWTQFMEEHVSQDAFAHRKRVVDRQQREQDAAGLARNAGESSSSKVQAAKWA